MRVHRASIYAAVAAAALTSGLAIAEPIDGGALLDLLVKKGIVSNTEAASLRSELASQPAPAAPAGPAAGAAAGSFSTPAAVVVQNKSPLSFKIGIADFTPVGFMDFTTVYRSTNVGSGIGTNFAGIPFNNTSAGQLSETRFSAQNSRLGLRIDSQISDTKVLGYVESDFLGNAPSNLNVSSNAATMRMRIYLADVKWENFEFMAGQDWSMLTPNRKGLGVLPGDIFFTSNMDTNYQAGLTWARQAQVRVMVHPTSEITAGVSLENPDQYAGGTNGAPSVTFPTGFNTGEVDTGAATSSPNVMPDVIAKIAYDTKVADRSVHVDLAGLYRTFKVNTFTTGATPVNSDSTATGTGLELSGNIELIKGLTLVGTGFWSQGGGRYIFGQAPDFVVRPDASGVYRLSTLRANSYIGGLEWQVAPKTLLFGYYSKVDIGSRYGKQSNGSYVGYGYPGAPSAQNRSIEEFTLGATQTLWKNPNYGALQVISQLSYVDRQVFTAPTGSSDKAHVGMAFVDFRYVLP